MTSFQPNLDMIFAYGVQCGQGSFLLVCTISIAVISLYANIYLSPTCTYIESCIYLSCVLTPRATASTVESFV